MSALLRILCLHIHVHKLTGQFADKLTRGRSSYDLANWRTSHIADSNSSKITETLH